MSEEKILELENICKRFGGTQALDNVSFEIRKGEVHALMGENGAGKSTLVKIISGVLTRDSGKISFLGKPFNARNPQEASTFGINIVHQELSLSPFLTVGENIAAVSAPMGTLKLMRPNQLETQAMNLLQINNISPKTIVKDLGVSAQQIVEIAGAISRKCSLLILDEPTSSLTVSESDELFKIIRLLQKQGVTIIYISHKISEVFQIADRITVLKDGHFMGTLDQRSTNEEQIISLMIGRNIQQSFAAHLGGQSECVLDVQGLSGPGFSDVSFKLHRGEILGFAGLTGAGRTELFTSVFGINRITRGRILIRGNNARIRSPKDAMQYGIGYLSEDRKQIGAFMDMDISDNIVAASIDDHSGKFFVDPSRIKQSTAKMVERLNIKLGSVQDKIFSLSGGNQQKAMLARWLLVNPEILIVDEPTRGIDVGAKQEVYQILNNLAEEGIAIVMISSELPEILAMSDRIIVMYRGNVIATLEGENRQEHFLAPAIIGKKNGVNGPKESLST